MVASEGGNGTRKKQSGYSRLESPTYGKLTVQTLLEIARGFDVGLLIKFVPFSRLVREYNDVSLPALSARSVTEKEEVQALEKWANEEPTPTQIFVDTSVFLNLLPHQVTTWEPILIRGTERDVETPTQRGLYPAAVPAGHSKLDPAVGRTITPLSRGHSTGEGAGYRSMVNG